MTGFKSTQVTSHYRNNLVCLLGILTAEGKQMQVRCRGFVCSQGAKFFTGAELGAIQAAAYTNGDGGEDSDWRLLQNGELIYCIVPPPKPCIGLECYILVDDNGWPIVVDGHPRSYMPPQNSFSDPQCFQHSGTAHFSIK